MVVARASGTAWVSRLRQNNFFIKIPLFSKSGYNPYHSEKIDHADSEFRTPEAKFRLFISMICQDSILCKIPQTSTFWPCHHVMTCRNVKKLSCLNLYVLSVPEALANSFRILAIFSTA